MTHSEEVQAYREFMFNPENSHNCDECPENRHFGNWQNRLPCGQHHCWVDQHTYANEKP